MQDSWKFNIASSHVFRHHGLLIYSTLVIPPPCSPLNLQAKIQQFAKSPVRNFDSAMRNVVSIHSLMCFSQWAWENAFSVFSYCTNCPGIFQLEYGLHLLAFFSDSATSLRAEYIYPDS